MSITIFTKQGNRLEMKDLAAYQEGVYVFAFYGDETYTDPYDGSVWNWEGTTNDIDEIISVAQGAINTGELFPVASLSECITQERSFFWDDVNGYLYVHWIESAGDFAVGGVSATYSELVAGYANGYHEASKNVFDGVYYEPRITGFSGGSFQVDPVKFGLISINDSSITYSDQIQEFYDTTRQNSKGLPVWTYAIEDDVTELTDDDRVFTGVIDGWSHDGENWVQKLIETRSFQNRPVCKNTVSIDDYPNAGDLEGALIPTAWGKIRRGKVVPVNSASLTTAASGTATLLVADPALYEILAISDVYDKEDNVMSITGTDLTACTVDVTKPAGVSVSDLKKWKWEGQGYDIDGDYNNGLDIVRAAFLSLANIEYLSTTYDQIEWGKQTNINDQSVGLSIQSDKGFFEEIIEPITISLQGSVQILGNGRITWIDRDITADPEFVVLKQEQLIIPRPDMNAKEVVSELFIEYSRDFVDKDGTLTLQYSVDQSYVIRNYGTDTRDPLSPIKTVLTEEADTQVVAEQIMSTSADPQLQWPIEQTEFYKDLKLLQIVGLDIAKTAEENKDIRYGEVLKIEPDYNNTRTKITIRELPDYVAPVYIQGEWYNEGAGNYDSYGFTSGEYDYDGYGQTEIIRSE